MRSFSALTVTVGTRIKAAEKWFSLWQKTDTLPHSWWSKAITTRTAVFSAAQQQRRERSFAYVILIITSRRRTRKNIHWWVAKILSQIVKKLLTFHLDEGSHSRVGRVVNVSSSQHTFMIFLNEENTHDYHQRGAGWILVWLSYSSQVQYAMHNEWRVEFFWVWFGSVEGR